MKTIKEIKNISNIKIKALEYALLKHDGQIRKLDGITPYIKHPVDVAITVSSFTDNRYVIAAAYLHDIVEMTDASLEDIEELFGYRVKRYVEKLSDLDKEIDWQERKQNIIDKVRTYSFEEKLLVAADKLCNLIDMNAYFETNGEDYSKFNVTKEDKEWYYRELYKSIIENQNPSFPLFRRLNDNIIEAYGPAKQLIRKIISN